MTDKCILCEKETTVFVCGLFCSECWDKSLNSYQQDRIDDMHSLCNEG